jgi:hypothetical protein
MRRILIIWPCQFIKSFGRALIRTPSYVASSLVTKKPSWCRVNRDFGAGSLINLLLES